MKVLLLIPCFCFVMSSIGIVCAKILNYESIFNFGDSLSDTGNSLVCDPVQSPIIGNPPYGQTFFQLPSGRFSDGRLVVDFIAEAAGLPYLPPYLGLDKGFDFRNGVNFAVGGATALDAKAWTNYSLSVQLGWFKKIKPSFCSTKQECDSFFKKSLFLVGEIGGNDFNYPLLLDGAKIEELHAMVHAVIEEISKTVSILIEEDGAVELVVPGNLPIGCSAEYLTRFQSIDKSDYNPANGCLIALNAFAKYYNNHLEEALRLLRQKYPHTRIIYADYYGAFMSMVDSAQHSGNVRVIKVACCGGGGPYNVNDSARCGQVGHTVCEDPLTYANWDGVHLTEAAYRHIAAALINGSFTYPSLNPSVFSNIDLGTYSG